MKKVDAADMESLGSVKLNEWQSTFADMLILNKILNKKRIFHDDIRIHNVM